MRHLKSTLFILIITSLILPGCSKPARRKKILRALEDFQITNVSGPRWGQRESDRFEVSPDTLLVNSETELTLTYTVGHYPLLAGDIIQVQFPASNLPDQAFPCWSPPQLDDPRKPGYFRASPSDSGRVKMAVGDFKFLNGLVEITVNREIAPGGRLTFFYSGAVQAIARSLKLRCYREGRLLHAPAWVVVLPDRAEILLAILPSVAVPGEMTSLSLVVLDRYGNLDWRFKGPVELSSSDSLSRGIPARCEFTAADSGRKTFEGVVFHSRGFQKVTVSMGDRIFQSNYCRVGEEGPESMRVYFGDLQFHTGTVTDTLVYGLGDHWGGYTSQEESYAYLRDVMMLDFAAATEHMYNQSFEEDVWERSQAICTHYDAPGMFTTFYGFEWHSNRFGHRVILYPSAGEPFFSSEAPASNEIDELWELLRWKECIVIPHPMSKTMGEGSHPLWAGTNNSLERLSEIFSNKASDEEDSWGAQKFEVGPDDSWSLQYAWKSGHITGITASSDDHLGHPGLNNFTESIVRSAGITGVWARRNDRSAVWESLMSRHTYGTTGTRIFLDLGVNDHIMGDVVHMPEPTEVKARGSVAGTSPLETVEILHYDGLNYTSLPIPLERGAEVCEFEIPLTVNSGQLLYLRAAQQDGEMAWSSPIWFSEKGDRAGASNQRLGVTGRNDS